MEHSISLLRSCRTQSLIPKLVAWKLYQFPFSSTVSISIESGKQCKRLDEIFFFREIENPTKFLCHLLLKINFKQNKIRRIMLMKPWSFKIHCHNMNTRTFFLSTYKHIKITIIVIISRWFIFLKTKSRREEEKKRTRGTRGFSYQRRSIQRGLNAVRKRTPGMVLEMAMWLRRLVEGKKKR